MTQRSIWQIVAAIAVVAPAMPSAQEPASVSGRVTDESGAAVVGAQVREEGRREGASTGSDGTYRVLIPAARLGGGGSARIVASALGLQSATRAVSLRSGAQAEVNFMLSRQAVSIDDVVVTGAGPQQASAERRRGSIPAHFHGRWARNQRACGRQHLTTVITIQEDGWSSFEEGGRVSRAGQVRRGTHYFRLSNYAGATESQGSLAMRREGPRIIMTFQDDGAQPVNYSLTRCRW